MPETSTTALPQLTRRTMLGGLASATLTSAAAAKPAPMPTREDLEDYFCFLWCEHRRIADELGVDVFDLMTLRKRGGRERYERTYSASASTRALGVLTQVGAAA